LEITSNRVLIVSPISHCPAFSGNAARVADVVSCLKALGVDLHFCLCPIRFFSYTNEDLELARNALDEKLYVLNKSIPYKGTIRQRFLRRIQVHIRRLIKRITGRAYYWNWMDYMFTDSYVSANMRSEFTKICNSVKPDIIVCEYVFLSALIKNTPVTTRLIVDTHDRFTKRNSKLRDEGINEGWLSLTERQESVYLNRFDTVWAIQNNEAKQFRRITRAGTAVETIDILTPPAALAVVTPISPVIGFLGSNNPHNLLGLERFLSNHWSKIRLRFPDVEFHIAGSINANIDSANQDGVRLVGRVESLKNFYDGCTIIVNPCPSGTGLKIKSIEALSHGKCLLTTAAGAEGIEDAGGRGMFIAALDSSEFTEKCCTILSGDDIPRQQGQQAIYYIQEKFDENVRKVLLAIKM
jgi:glycosyltransferase involved in cell wall biosynthesis